jgi:hypothetical protein
LCAQCEGDRSEWVNIPYHTRLMRDSYDFACSQGGECISCPASEAGFVVLALVVVWLYAIIILYTAQSSRGAFKILIFFLQTAFMQIAPETSQFVWYDAC